MGATFSVTLKIKVKDEEGAIKYLKEYIISKPESFKNAGRFVENNKIDQDTLDGLIHIFIGDRLRSNFRKWTPCNSEFITYTSDINASYGWGIILTDMFIQLAPFLYDDSTIIVDEDLEGYCYGEIHSGLLDWIY